MKNKLDKCASEYGAVVLLKHLTALCQEIEGVRQAADIECIHRMRVASRRLRSALTIFENCLPAKSIPGWTRQIRRITRALGAARDHDVQIERLNSVIKDLPSPNLLPGMCRLKLRVEQKRSLLQIKVNKALSDLEASHTLQEMDSTLQSLIPQYPPETIPPPATQVLYTLAFDAISERLTQFLSYETCIYQPESIAELHAMRISAKGLRYTLEAFASLFSSELKPALPTVRKVQDTLGEIHDRDVWSVYLPQFMIDEKQRTFEYYGHTRPYNPLVPGLNYFLKTCQEDRIRLYEEFINDWDTWKKEDLWNDLLDVVSTPLHPNAMIFPLLSTVEPEGQDPV